MAVVFAYKVAASRVGCAHSGLGITALNTSRVLNEFDYGVEPWGVFDGFDLVKRLRSRPDVTHVVMLAPWVDTPWLERTVMAFPDIEWSVCCHSNVGFLQADPYAVKLMRQQILLERNVHNFHVSANSTKLVNAVKAAFNAPCTYLPNLYPANKAHWIPRRYRDGVLRIGIFSATRQLKNILTAAWSAAITGRKMACDTEVWMSSGRLEGDGGVLRAVHELFEDLPHIKLVETGWQSWPRFIETVRQMHVMLQPSFTESHNNVVSDGIANGVPTAVSPAIDWVPKDWQANPDDACALSETTVRLIRDVSAPRRGFRALERSNTLGVRAWREYLDWA